MVHKATVDRCSSQCCTDKAGMDKVSFSAHPEAVKGDIRRRSAVSRSVARRKLRACDNMTVVYVIIHRRSTRAGGSSLLREVPLEHRVTAIQVCHLHGNQAPTPSKQRHTCTQRPANNMPTVTALCIYPVKSLKGINVTSAPICETGFLWDRQWMLTRPDGRFLTQRQIPKMTLVVTSLPQEALSNEWGQLSPDAALTLNAPGMEPLHVPLKHPAPSEAELKQCTCWEWSGLARDEGEDAASWLTEFLGKPVRLVRYVGQVSEGTAETNPKRRACEPEFGNGTETMFPDGYPYLLTTESSLRDLNSKVPEPMDMNRFRPNIVIDDSVAPWEEDNWQSFTLGGAPDRAVTFHSLKPCSRCKVTTTNQETGEVGKEPLMTLGKYRSGKALGWSAMGAWKHEVFFGWNLGADASGTIAVGDELKVTRTRTAPMAA